MVEAAKAKLKRMYSSAPVAGTIRLHTAATAFTRHRGVAIVKALLSTMSRVAMEVLVRMLTVTFAASLTWYDVEVTLSTKLASTRRTRTSRLSSRRGQDGLGKG